MALTGHTVLFGGSFNPPHMGHQIACLYLLEALRARDVWLMPAHVHPLGKDLVDFQHRLRMCEILARPFDARVSVSAAERDVGGSGRTYELVRHLLARHPGARFALAVGADILGETDQWYRWDELRALVPVVVLGRGGAALAGETPMALPQVSSSDIRGRIAGGLSIEGLVPAGVADYIAEHGLYSPERAHG